MQGQPKSFAQIIGLREKWPPETEMEYWKACCAAYCYYINLLFTRKRKRIIEMGESRKIKVQEAREGLCWLFAEIDKKFGVIVPQDFIEEYLNPVVISKKVAHFAFITPQDFIEEYLTSDTEVISCPVFSLSISRKELLSMPKALMGKIYYWDWYEKWEDLSEQ